MKKIRRSRRSKRCNIKPIKSEGNAFLLLPVQIQGSLRFALNSYIKYFECFTLNLNQHCETADICISTGSLCKIMNTEDLWEGANQTVINARNLFLASEALCDLNHYGPATSLVILAAEEAIKAMTYAYCSIAESGNTTQIEQDMLSHATKHELGLYYFHLHHMSSRLIKFAIYLGGRKDFTDDKRLKIVTDYLELYKKELDGDKYNEIRVVTEWKKSANRVKNECLYVGQYKGHWRNPSHTSIKTYKKQKKVCSYFVEAAEASILSNEVEKLRSLRDQLFR